MTKINKGRRHLTAKDGKSALCGKADGYIDGDKLPGCRKCKIARKYGRK